MRAKLRLSTLLLLASVVHAQAASLGLLWRFDRSFVPAPEVFVLTATQAGGVPPQQFRVPPAAEGACTRLPQGQADDFCTVLACPAPGSVVAYWVQAVWPEETTGPVEVVTCWFKPGEAPCLCQDPATAVPPASRPPPPMGPTPPLAGLPPLQTTPPPRPQQTAEGLNLLPIGTLPALPTLPPLPASGGV